MLYIIDWQAANPHNASIHLQFPYRLSQVNFPKSKMTEAQLF